MYYLIPLSEEPQCTDFLAITIRNVNGLPRLIVQGIKTGIPVSVTSDYPIVATDLIKLQAKPKTNEIIVYYLPREDEQGNLLIPKSESSAIRIVCKSPVIKEKIKKTIEAFFFNYPLYVYIHQHHNVACEQTTQRSNTPSITTVVKSTTDEVKEERSKNESVELDFFTYLASFDISVQLYTLMNLTEYFESKSYLFEVWACQPLVPNTRWFVPFAFVFEIAENIEPYYDRVPEIVAEMKREDPLTKIGCYCLLMISALLEYKNSFIDYVRRYLIESVHVAPRLVGRELIQKLVSAHVQRYVKDVQVERPDVYIRYDVKLNKEVSDIHAIVPSTIAIKYDFNYEPVMEYKKHKVYTSEYLAYLYHMYEEKPQDNEIRSLYEEIGKWIHLIRDSFQSEILYADQLTKYPIPVIKAGLNKLVDEGRIPTIYFVRYET